MNEITSIVSVIVAVVISVVSLKQNQKSIEKAN